MILMFVYFGGKRDFEEARSWDARGFLKAHSLVNLLSVLMPVGVSVIWDGILLRKLRRPKDVSRMS